MCTAEGTLNMRLYDIIVRDYPVVHNDRFLFTNLGDEKDYSFTIQDLFSRTASGAEKVKFVHSLNILLE